MMKIISCLLVLLMLSSCTKLEFFGDTFYTVQGKIIDVNNNPIPNFDLKVLGSIDALNFSPQGGTFAADAVAATSVTDANGFFRLTFPKSNGTFFLEMKQDFVIKDSVTTNSQNKNLARIKIEKMRDFLLDFQNIKVQTP